MKLIALYKTPEDPEAFDDAYYNTHLPLIEKVPGLQEATVTKFTRVVVGDADLYQMAEMKFPDKESLYAAMKSPEMAAAGENLDTFAKGLYSLLFAESK